MHKTPDHENVEVWTDILSCPRCHGELALCADELPSGRSLKCVQCSAKYPGVAGSFDFTIVEGERELERKHYQEKYLRRTDSGVEDFDPKYWANRWMDPHWPEGRLILRQLGDMEGKVVLCLGNGNSLKELHFLTLGARLICSDLSMSGILSTRYRYNLSELATRGAFHAMDACRLAAKDNSVDVIYGYEFVHHLPDLDVFLREVHRVLTPDGFCVFFDGGYSAIWQKAKTTFLWPLMRLSHLLYRRSPEDIRATYAGGYRESVLKDLAAKHGFRETFFERTMFFQYLFANGVAGLFGSRLPRLCYRVPGAIGRVMDYLLTDRWESLRRNRIGLVWGFRS